MKIKDLSCKSQYLIKKIASSTRSEISDLVGNVGKKKLLTQAVELEVEQAIESQAHLKDLKGHRLVVRNGKKSLSCSKRKRLLSFIPIGSFICVNKDESSVPDSCSFQL